MKTYVTFEYFDANVASVYRAIRRSSIAGELPETEYDRFRLRFQDDESRVDELREIVGQIQVMVDNGLIYTLRDERQAFALPAKDRRLARAFFRGKPDGVLRLYCLQLPDDVLVLCGGGVKDAKNVQDSPDVIPHFQFANRLAIGLNDRLNQEVKPLTYQRIEEILESETIEL